MPDPGVRRRKSLVVLGLPQVIIENGKIPRAAIARSDIVFGRDAQFDDRPLGRDGEALDATLISPLDLEAFVVREIEIGGIACFGEIIRRRIGDEDIVAPREIANVSASVLQRDRGTQSRWAIRPSGWLKR